MASVKSRLSGRIGGIPIWVIALAVGAVLYIYWKSKQNAAPPAGMGSTPAIAQGAQRQSPQRKQGGKGRGNG